MRNLLFLQIHVYWVSDESATASPHLVLEHLRGTLNPPLVHGQRSQVLQRVVLQEGRLERGEQRAAELLQQLGDLAVQDLLTGTTNREMRISFLVEGVWKECVVANVASLSCVRARGYIPLASCTFDHVAYLVPCRGDLAEDGLGHLIVQQHLPSRRRRVHPLAAQGGAEARRVQALVLRRA